MNRLSVWLGVLVSITVLVGAIYAFDGRYAKSGEIKLVAQRLDVKILQDKIDGAQVRIWKLQDRYRKNPDAMPQETRDQIRRLQVQITDWQSQLSTKR